MGTKWQYLIVEVATDIINQSPYKPLILKRYIDNIFSRWNINQEAIKNFTKLASSYSWRSTGMSYTRTREIVLQAFAEIGYPKQLFGFHSLRAGGSSAAANAGVSDRLFKRHGRWRTDRAKDGYIKASLESLLLVSKSLHA